MVSRRDGVCVCVCVWGGGGSTANHSDGVAELAQGLAACDGEGQGLGGGGGGVALLTTVMVSRRDGGRGGGGWRSTPNHSDGVAELAQGLGCV